jgi:WD40 repeat protein
MRILQGHRGPVLCLAYAPDGRSLASGGWDKTVRIWDTAAGTPRAVLQDNPEKRRPVLALAFSPDGRTLAVGTDQGLALWDVVTGPATTLSAGGTVHTLAFSPDGRTLATEGRLWDLAHQRVQRNLPRTHHDLYGLAFAPGGTLLAAACGRSGRRSADGGEVQVLDPVDTRATWDVLGTGAVFRCLAISPDGGLLAAGGAGGELRLWDLPRRRERHRWGGHADVVLGTAFTPDGRTLASASVDGVIRLWDTAGGPAREAFDWDISTVRAVAFAPDGMTAAAGGFDSRILVWDLE